MFRIKAKKTGFTLVEMVTVIAIMGILLGLSLKTWSSYLVNKKVESAALNVVSVFDSARVSAMTSKNAQVYGVTVASTSVTSFGGSVFNINDLSNEVNVLDGVSVATTTLTAGVSTIIFARFTGLPSATGTLYLVSKKDSNVIKIIQISDSGLAKIL